MSTSNNLSQAIEMVALYTKAEAAVLKGKSYSIGDRSVTRADLAEIRAGRAEWEKTVQRLSAVRPGPKVYRTILRDL